MRVVEYGDGKILMHDMEDKDASQLPQFREREAVQVFIRIQGFNYMHA